jgi:hypothetical protein
MIGMLLPPLADTHEWTDRLCWLCTLTRETVVRGVTDTQHSLVCGMSDTSQSGLVQWRNNAVRRFRQDYNQHSGVHKFSECVICYSSSVVCLHQGCPPGCTPVFMRPLRVSFHPQNLLPRPKIICRGFFSSLQQTLREVVAKYSV